MALTIADTYYLKALDLYPYELDEVTEALNYAIGYDDEHPGAHYLFGLLNMNQLGKPEAAEYHFEKVLATDINHSWTYYAYTDLLIQTGAYDRAASLIKYSYKVKGISKTRMIYREALIAEIRGDLKGAKHLMKTSYETSCNSNQREYLKNELARIKSKLKSRKRSRR